VSYAEDAAEAARLWTEVASWASVPEEQPTELPDPVVFGIPQVMSRSLGWLEDIRPGVVQQRHHAEPPLYQDRRVHCPRCGWCKPDSDRVLRRYRRHWYRRHVD
jgi:hypothetical protein